MNVPPAVLDLWCPIHKSKLSFDAEVIKWKIGMYVTAQSIPPTLLAMMFLHKLLVGRTFSYF